jgi:hypothetical protein
MWAGHGQNAPTITAFHTVDRDGIRWDIGHDSGRGETVDLQMEGPAGFKGGRKETVETIRGKRIQERPAAVEGWPGASPMMEAVILMQVAMFVANMPEELMPGSPRAINRWWLLHKYLEKVVAFQCQKNSSVTWSCPVMILFWKK